MNRIFLSVVYLIIFFSINIQAQNTRLSDNNTIGWFSVNGTFKLSSRISFITEYHWRRTDLVNKWQIGLWRSSINYQIHPKVQVRFGYGLIENFPYGNYPINSFGKQFTENRMFQAIVITDKISIVEVSHRFMLEQRWIGKYSAANLTKEDIITFTNRFRYMFRVQLPIFKSTMEDNTAYFAGFNEIMVGFGKNVNENIFDQNRLALMLGYKFTGNFRIEGGYLNHIFQLAREIDGRNVFQHNNGIIFNFIVNFDFSKKTTLK